MTALWTDDRVAEVARLYAEGRTQREIGEICGATGAAIRKLMKRRGLPARRPGRPGPAPRPSALDSLAAEVARLYAGGLTQREIGEAFGVSKSAVKVLMQRAGIPSRGRGHAGGPAHPSWKGDAAGYYQLHRRVRQLRGTPSRCEECGTTDPAKTYDWANLTGDYADPDDYKRLCRRCHIRFDNARRKAVAPCL